MRVDGNESPASGRTWQKWWWNWLGNRLNHWLTWGKTC